MKYSGIWIPNSQLEPMRDALRQWMIVHRRYNDNMARLGKQDVSYVYGERSQVGMLASAICMAGGVALEEFGDEKRHPRRRKETWSGRVDLRFAIGPLNCTAEAKAYLMCLKPDDPASKVAASLDYRFSRARHDVGLDPAGGLRLGLVFASPWLMKSGSDAPRLQASIELLVTAAKKLKPSFIAWHFDRQPFCDADKCYRPGVLLMGGIVSGERRGK